MSSLKPKTLALLSQSQLTRKRLIEKTRYTHAKGRLGMASPGLHKSRIKKARQGIAHSLKTKRQENDHFNVRAWRRAGGE